LNIDPEDTEALVDKGLVLEDLNRTEEAVQYYDRVLAIDPGEVDAQDSALLSLSSLAKLNQNTSATN